MALSVMLVDIHGTKLLNMYLGTVPDMCPICHRAVHPKIVTDGHYNRDVNIMQVCFRCTALKCQQLFIGSYTDNGALVRTEPLRPIPPVVPEELKAISPSFVEIYTQAFAAQAQSLTQLVGVGLRKSLEYLVKDFAISLHSDEAEAIRGMWLGPVIEKYIDDPFVKRTATLATWLGNDETHYLRKWETKDITDLMRLLKLTMNWMQSYILSHQYFNEMEPNKK
jgi:hypothetical protein